MRLQHDNARPHTARATAQHIEEQNIRLLRQPAYSPDTNLCDRYLFPRLEAIRNTFDSHEDIKEFLDAQLPYFSSNRMKTALEASMTRMEKVLEIGGKYV